MRINNGIYMYDIVEYQNKKYEVVGIENGMCKLKGSNNELLNNIDVFKCTKIKVDSSF